MQQTTTALTHLCGECVCVPVCGCHKQDIRCHALCVYEDTSVWHHKLKLVGKTTQILPRMRARLKGATITSYLVVGFKYRVRLVLCQIVFILSPRLQPFHIELVWKGKRNFDEAERHTRCLTDFYPLDTNIDKHLN